MCSFPWSGWVESHPRAEPPHPRSTRLTGKGLCSGAGCNGAVPFRAGAPVNPSRPMGSSLPVDPTLSGGVSTESAAARQDPSPWASPDAARLSLATLRGSGLVTVHGPAGQLRCLHTLLAKRAHAYVDEPGHPCATMLVGGPDVGYGLVSRSPPVSGRRRGPWPGQHWGLDVSRQMMASTTRTRVRTPTSRPASTDIPTR